MRTHIRAAQLAAQVAIRGHHLNLRAARSCKLCARQAAMAAVLIEHQNVVASGNRAGKEIPSGDRKIAPLKLPHVRQSPGGNDHHVWRFARHITGFGHGVEANLHTQPRHFPGHPGENARQVTSPCGLRRQDKLAAKRV